MRIIILLSIFIFSGHFCSAQAWVTDTAEMGARFSYDLFYKLDQGVFLSKMDRNSWDMAFYVSTSGQSSFSAAVRANHDKESKDSLPKVLVYSIHQPGTYWPIVSYKDTINLDDPLYNDTTDIDLGAFNQNRDSSNLFDFGWGKYNSSNHNLYGDSIYLVNNGARFFKIIIDSLDGYTSTWYLRVGDLDSVGFDHKVVINHSTSTVFNNKTFAYFDVSQGNDLDLEPDSDAWDLKFTKSGVYYSTASAFFDETVGPEVNRRHTVARLQQVDPAIVDSTHVLGLTFSKDYSMIARDWAKNYKFDSLGNQSFFVKPGYDTSYIFQIIVTGAEEQLGDVYFAYRAFRNPTSVADIAPTLSSASIFPNPCSIGHIYLNIDSKSALQNLHSKIYDIMGRVVHHSEGIKLDPGANFLEIPVDELPTGTYVLQIYDEQQQYLSSIVEIQPQ